MDKHWENPELIGFGRLPARATFQRYTVDSDHDDTDDLIPSEVLLDSNDWRFLRIGHPNSKPTSCFDVEFDDSDWLQMKVPSLWTMDDRIEEDKPIYTNIQIPFDFEPPGIPHLNPTGLYRRIINFSSKQQRNNNKRRIIVHVGGVESCFYIYCNGIEVGFSKDSRLPSEFDITEYCGCDENSGNDVVCIGLMVMRWNDCTFIEDQDQWWHAGIHRSVKLITTPKNVYVRDIYAKPKLILSDNKGSGRNAIQGATLDIDVRLEAPLCSQNAFGYQVEAKLFFKGSPVGLLGKYRGSISKENFKPVSGKGLFVKLSGSVVDNGNDKEIHHIHPWSAETPNLYDLHITLQNASKRITEVCKLKIGFRSIEVINRELLINGVAVLVRGVNRHDHSDTTGKVMTRDLMREDIITMKQHNINAVRTSHYPNDPLFYDLCDELGLYIVDEANLEAHHHYQQLGSDPYWSCQFVARGSRMVERDKNHPCIIMWSVGNETGFGPNHMAMTAFIRQYDPSRPICNECAICEQGVQDMWESNHHGTDVICPMYPSVDDIVNHAKTTKDTRPLIMCEYAHAMGNSCGNLLEYWDAVEKYKGLQGGFIWEWIDHGIKKKSKDGIEFWAYGGDFNEERHDLNFVCDGLCFPDRTPHTSLVEYKKIIQPVCVRPVDWADDNKMKQAKIQIHNKHDFISLGEIYTGSWILYKNGSNVAAGKLSSDLSIPPHTKKTVIVALPTSCHLEKHVEISLVVEFRLSSTTSWAPTNFLVAWDQMQLQAPEPYEPPVLDSSDPCNDVYQLNSLEPGSNPFDNNKVLSLRNKKLKLTFDSSSLTEFWLCEQVNFFFRSPEFNFWRAPTDNDGIKGWTGQGDKPLGIWKSIGLDQIRWQNTTRLLSNCQVAIENSGELPGGACIKGRITYILVSDRVTVLHEVDIPESIYDLPRIGVRFALPGTFEKLRWFGRGPHETYVDRKQSGRLQIHSSDVHSQYVPYILPQEHGNLTDVRWIELISDNNKLKIVPHAPLEFSASHYPYEILEPAFHTHEIKPDNAATWVTLDIAHRGLGGGSCGPDTLEQYRVSPGKYSFAFDLLPY